MTSSNYRIALSIATECAVAAGAILRADRELLLL